MGGLTFFYNPLIVSLFDRVSWVMIDVAAIFVLAAAPFYCPVAEKSQAHESRYRRVLPCTIVPLPGTVPLCNNTGLCSSFKSQLFQETGSVSK
jgi:hypothetical protein